MFYPSIRLNEPVLGYVCIPTAIYAFTFSKGYRVSLFPLPDQIMVSNVVSDSLGVGRLFYRISVGISCHELQRTGTSSTDPRDHLCCIEQHRDNRLVSTFTARDFQEYAYVLPAGSFVVALFAVHLQRPMSLACVVSDGNFPREEPW